MIGEATNVGAPTFRDAGRDVQPEMTSVASKIKNNVCFTFCSPGCQTAILALPVEAHSPLIVDANVVFSDSISRETLQLIRRRDA